jgi:hypothetical protein
MRRLFLVTALLAGFIIRSELCFGQVPLAANRVSALKGLRSLAVMIRPNTPKEVATIKEWGDMVTVGLAQKAPAVNISDSTNSPNVAWLELSVITTDRGAVLVLSLHRWVRVRDSGEDVFAPVWSDHRVCFGCVSKSDLQESLDTLLTSFAADYLRANR